MKTATATRVKGVSTGSFSDFKKEMVKSGQPATKDEPSAALMARVKMLSRKQLRQFTWKMA